MANEQDIRLAIVIPYFKIDFFENALKSLALQSNKHFNVYIGDDASSMPALALVQKYQNEFNCVFKRFDKNLGGTSLVKQWDRCISLTANEPWIMVLCDDDVLSENVVASFYENMTEIKENDIQVVKFASQIIDGSGAFISEKFTQPKLQDYATVFYKRFFENYRSSLSEHVFTRNAYEKHGFRDIPFAWHADDFAWLDFSEFGKVFTINEASVYFRDSEVNISRSTYLSEEKKLLQYQFYETIVYSHLQKFKSKYRLAILKRFEHLTYGLNKNDIKFWKQFFSVKFKNEGIVEALKFTRRMYLNRKPKK